MSEIQTRVLTLYAVKSIKDKAEAYLKEAKDKLIPVKIDPDKAQSMTIEEGDLQVKFSPTKGKKTFDVLKARAFLKDRLGEQFDSYFSSYKIEATNKQPPKELVDQMNGYGAIVAGRRRWSRSTTGAAIATGSASLCPVTGRPTRRLRNTH